jgi:hypothetical protein
LDPRTRVVEEREHKIVATPFGLGAVGAVKDRAELLLGQVAEEPTQSLLERDGEDLLRQRGGDYILAGGVGEKRVDGGQPCVAGGYGVGPHLLEVIEEA